MASIEDKRRAWHAEKPLERVVVAWAMGSGSGMLPLQQTVHGKPRGSLFSVPAVRRLRPRLRNIERCRPGRHGALT